MGDEQRGRDEKTTEQKPSREAKREKRELLSSAKDFGAQLCTSKHGGPPWWEGLGFQTPVPMGITACQLLLNGDPLFQSL
ncbi:hypothetical protein EYF80_013920 [Liparis tanakae]|uniref:Uncharacterized protein n=1 Tax=Liparis tanakae TaxID=230148 RepID=A0A4Z2IFA8_9TELE|nr:hypothetical protein EYF80_013920 [Liparis tanakae]